MADTTQAHLLLWAPKPNEVSSGLTRERIEAARTVDLPKLAAAVRAFADCHAGLWADMVKEVKDACPRGVPDDYFGPVEEANGWRDFEAAFEDALRPLTKVVAETWAIENGFRSVA